MCLNGTPCDRGKHWDGCRRQNIGGWKKATLSLRIIYGTQFMLHHFHLFLSWMKNTFAVGWRRSLQRGFAFIDAHFIPRDRRERAERSGPACCQRLCDTASRCVCIAYWPTTGCRVTIALYLFLHSVVPVLNKGCRPNRVFQGIFTHFIATFYFKSTLYCVASHIWCSVF